MSTALYRRYRPETFADVIGQEHVTEPLITALENDRVNHAYLFSGPRGCGKTTSARILARCLNCAHGPTATPCGTCDSCRELSRDGGGSLDVIEMDAASHGGVDHARDLRERATFAPVRDRYKIFIIDEAHMVTREGFNALLKIVEEPPEHIKFIFATTEPNKVLGTIRSRTHHYPFRLVPPETLLDYMQKLCDEEGVQVENGVLQLVVRAGGGSVRDSLSILDQLMAGSDDAGITYDLAVALLGFTHGGLLDDVLSSFASGNAAEVFASVDRVIQTGQDPRRFVEDLLERFRDLIIVQAAPDSAQAILRGLSADQLSRLREQAASFGGAELSRAADITNAALNEMSGATSPQLHLELLCARILLPVSDKTLGGLGARLDRLERRVTSGQVASTGVQGQLQDARPARSAPSAMPAVSEQASSEVSSEGNQNTGVDQNPAGLVEKSAPLANLRRQQTAGSTQTPAQAAAGRGVQHEKQAESQPAQTTEQPQQNSDSAQASKPQKPEKTQVSEQPQVSEQAQPSSAQQAPQGHNTVLMVRNAWHDVLSRVQSPPARTWFGSCEPSKFEQGALYIRADIGTLRRVKDYIPQLKSALNEVLQLNVEIHAEVAKPGQSGQASLAGSSQSNPSQVGSSQQAQTPQQNQAPQAHPSQQAQTPQPASSGPNAQASNPADVQQVPLADGPRGGEEAWRAHGQPRTNEAPQWSTEDWNNPVTDWAVASIPSGEADNESAEDQTENQSVSQDSAHESNPAPKNSSASQTASAPLSEAPSPHPQEPAPETAPQLRVIKGEAPENPSPEDQARENHPSSGRWRRPEISAAPDPERSQNEDEEANVPDDYTPTTGIADGSVEPANAEDSVIPDPEPEAEAPEQPPVPAPAPLAERVQQSERQQQGQGSRFRERFAAQLEAGHRASEQAAQRSQPNSFDEPEDFTASDDDETLEASVLIGQRAVEKVLGGVVIEEQQLGQ